MMMDEIIIRQIGNKTIMSKSDKFRERIRAKCEAVLKLVIGVQQYYNSTDDKDRKAIIETTIGAAIWYLPKSKKYLFTGKISKEAIDKGEKSEEHLFPRKIAAKKILEFNWTAETEPVEKFMTLYIEEYGRYNYVSKAENKKLAKFQKDEKFDTAYERAGIELVCFNTDKHRK